MSKCSYTVRWFLLLFLRLKSFLFFFLLISLYSAQLLLYSVKIKVAISLYIPEHNVQNIFMSLQLINNTRGTIFSLPVNTLKLSLLTPLFFFNVAVDILFWVNWLFDQMAKFFTQLPSWRSDGKPILGLPFKLLHLPNDEK